MTRALALLSLLLSLTAFGQTYVRPSKGAPINPFPDAGTTYTIADPDTMVARLTSPAWDWSAFEAMRIRISGSGSGRNYDNTYTCSNLTTQYTVAEIGAFAKLRIGTTRVAIGYPKLDVLDATAVNGTYRLTTGVNNSFSLQDYSGCPTEIRVTPIPFAPATVSAASSSVTTDDGGIVVAVTTTQIVTDAGMPTSAPYCTVSRSSAVSVGTSVTAVPIDGGLSGRWMLRACNSARNSGTPIVTCATGGATPDAGALSDGEALEVGDCATWTTGETVTCISDTAATAVSTWECR